MDIEKLKMIDRIYFLIDWLSTQERYSDIDKLIEILDFEMAQEHANLNNEEIENLKMSVDGWPIDREKLKRSVTKISNVYLHWEELERQENQSENGDDEMKTYTFLDFETTGLDPKNDQVIEIGAIKTDSKFREIGSLNTFVTLNHGTHLTKTITDLTGIRESDLKTGLLEQLALQALDNFIADSIVVAHHIPFDLSFLERLHSYQPIDQFICTRSICKYLYPNESAKLEDVCKKFGITNKKRHRAMNDARVVKNLYKRLKEEMKEFGKSELSFINVLVNSSERPVKYRPNIYTRIIQLNEVKDRGSY